MAAAWTQIIDSSVQFGALGSPIQVGSQAI